MQRKHGSVFWLTPLLAGALLAAPLAPAATPAAGQRTEKTITLARGMPAQTPLYVIDSGREGPSVMVVGGVHGNEPGGAWAAEAIRTWPITQGRLLVLPRANIVGLYQNTRFVPGASKDQRDLNRNFPRPGEKAKPPRGTLANVLWTAMRSHRPAWVIDLHESATYRAENKKYLGSSIIVSSSTKARAAADAMIESVNRVVTNEKYRFVRLRSPIKGSLARAAAEHLGAGAMICETGRKNTSLATRCRYHRHLAYGLLRHLKMIPAGQNPDRPTRPAGFEGVHVALYAGSGAGGKGPGNLLKLFTEAPRHRILPIGPAEIAAGALKDFDVVIFPGGTGSGQARALGKDGRKRVRAFVEAGGGYVGICAGAYLAMRGFSWGVGVLDAKTVSPKWRRGAGTVKAELTPAGREVLGTRTGPFAYRYANGPIFRSGGAKDIPDYTAWALFRTEVAKNDSPKGVMVNSPAICGAPFGRGRVVISSGHPEQTPGLGTMVLRAVDWAAPRAIARGE